MRIDITPAQALAILRGWAGRKPKARLLGRWRTHDGAAKRRRGGEGPPPGRSRPASQIIDDIAGMILADGATCVSTSPIGPSTGDKLPFSFWLVARTSPGEPVAFALEVRGRSPQECHKLRAALWLRFAPPASNAVH